MKLDGQPIANYEQLAQKLASRSDAVHFDVLRPREVPAPGATLWRDEPVKLDVSAPPKPGAYGIEASDLTLFAVQPGSAADQAGLRRGDRVLAVNGTPALSWGDEVDAVIFIVKMREDTQDHSRNAGLAHAPRSIVDAAVAAQTAVEKQPARLSPLPVVGRQAEVA